VTQPSARRRHRRTPPLSLLILPLAACGTFSTGSTEFRPDGTVMLKCSTSLPRCLERAEEACHGTRYEVLSAADNHDYYGPSNVSQQTEVRSSEAVVRCGQQGWSLFGGAVPVKAAKAASAAAAPAPAPAPRACVPGATQLCFGPGACRGGQACLGDGSGFTACACAPPAVDAGPVETP
jgi:hypothetical protein